MFTGLVHFIAEIILSIVILRGTMFNKGSGFLGVIGGLDGIVVGIVNRNFYVSFVLSLLLAVWLSAVGYSLITSYSLTRLYLHSDRKSLLNPIQQTCP
jgi:hypothetical protein